MTPAIDEGRTFSPAADARARLGVASLLACTLLYALLRLLPWLPHFFDVSLDASWDWVFHEGWVRGWVSGRDLVFTYGPFGFVPGGYFHPETYVTSLLVHAALVSVMAFAVWFLLRRWTGSAWKATPWSVLWIEANRLYLPGESMFAHLALLLVLVHFAAPGERAPRTTVHALAVSAALAALIKFTLFLGAFAAIGCVAAERILVARRFPWAAATFAVSMVGWWLVAGQPLDALTSYLSTSAHISSGYSEAMAVDGPPLHFLLFVPAAALVWVLLGRAVHAQGGAVRLLFHASLFAQCFLLFKAAFVRHDSHAVLAPATLLPWLVLGSFASTGRSATRIGRMLVAVCAALVLALAQDALVLATGHGLPRTITDGLARLPEEALASWNVLTGNARYGLRHRQAKAAIREDWPLPPVEGTVDVYPTTQAVVLAHGLEYRPRPVLQSYCAFTPKLQRLDADRLAGPAAPEHVFFAVLPIDGRYASFDDALSWPHLLSRYEFAGVHARHVWLRRSTRPSEFHLRELAALELAFGRLHELPEAPQGTLLWAQLRFEPTVAGKVVTWCFRPPLMKLDLLLRDGQTLSYRLVPGAAREGFLLSPAIADLDDFAQLASRSAVEDGSRDVVALGVSRVGTREPNYAYAPTFRLDLSVLELVPRQGSAPPLDEHE